MNNGPEMISERGTILSDTKEPCLSRSVTLNSISVDEDQSEVEEVKVTTEEPQFPLRRVNPVEKYSFRNGVTIEECCTCIQISIRCPK